MDRKTQRAFAQAARLATLARWGPVLTGLSDARECLDLWLTAELAACTDELFARRFQRLQPTFDAPWQAFLPRVVDAEGVQLLAGIRFKGGDGTQPFVRVAAFTATDPDPSRWAAPLARAFERFQPLAVQVRWPGAQSPCAGAVADQHHVMAPLTTLRDHPRPWGEVGVDTRIATDVAFHDTLVERFDAWRAQVGPREAEVYTSDRSDLLDALSTGVVVTAHQGEAWRGVMAARRASHRFADGYEVVELFLDAPLRGARRAQVLQRRLIDALVDHGRDVLWGTIHASNRPSLRAAQRCGRRIVETSWFVPLGS